MAADNGSIGTDGCTLLNERLMIPGAALGILGPGGQVVGEHTGGAAEHIVLQLHALVHRDVVLELAAVADVYVIRYVHVLAE